MLSFRSLCLVANSSEVSQARPPLKILIVKLSAIGDVIHCLPVAAAIKSAIPDCHLAWLVDKGSAELLENNKSIDEVITFDGKAWSRDLKNPANLLRIASEFSNFIRQLRARGFDVALEMQGLFKSGALALASGAGVRMGFNGTREFAESFLTHRIDVGDYFGHAVPVVELNLKIVDALLQLLGLPPRSGDPEFSLPATTEPVWQKIGALVGAQNLPDLSYIKNVREENSAKSRANSAATPLRANQLKEPLGGGQAPQAALVPGAPSTTASPQVMPSVEGTDIKESDFSAKPLCVLIPGTTWVTKIWPAEYWYQLGVKLIEQYDYKLLIIGAKSEVEANNILAAKLNAVRSGAALDLTTQTSLLDLVAIFKCSKLVIGGDTGPLHLAAAVNIPRVLGIYGSTPWRRNGPYGQKCRSVSLSLDCQPCYSKHCRIQTIDCLRSLSVEQVLAAISQLQEGIA